MSVCYSTPGGPVKYDFVHMLDQAFSKQPLNEFCTWPKMTPKQVLAQFSPVIISPLNKYVFDKSYNTENMTLIATPEKFETPLFLKNGVFAPLNASRASRVVFKKTPPFTRFSGRACVRSHTWLAPPGETLHGKVF